MASEHGEAEIALLAGCLRMLTSGGGAGTGLLGVPSMAKHGHHGIMLDNLFFFFFLPIINQ